MNQFIGKQFDQYQIGPLLGEGGMGAVYHAHDLKNNRSVALKIMLANLTNKPHFQQRFHQEAEVCANFNSPAIVKIYGNGTVDGYPYMAMEYIEGGSLAHYVNQIGWSGSRLPLDEVLALSAQIAEGLAYAHQRGLIHRDIKPDNILLKLRDGATGSPRQAVISDFGLAVQLKTADDSATNPFMGSLAYMSPEQCENSGLDGRSDIYALGIMLYELTTGQLPFQINAPADIVKHIQETPLPPRLINPQLPQPVEDIILKAIAKKPNERYQTAAEMAHALRQLAADDALLTAVPLERQNAVTQWLENKWIASVNVQDRVDTSKTWTSDGRYRLFVTSQHEESEIHGLNKPIITIGRSADNDIVLEDRTISAHHTSLSMSDNGNGGWLARDLGSTNGSYLGDRTLAFEEDVHWDSEEVLRIGPYHLKWQLFSGENGVAAVPLAGAALLGAAAMGTVAVGAAVIANGSSDHETPIADFDGGTAVSSSENLSVAITPETAVLEPDVDLPIDISITNTGITVQEVSIRLFDSSGRHPLWIRLDENRIKLLPEESVSLTAVANLPADFHMDAGEHILNVQATSDRGESETAVITLALPDSESFTLDMHPSNLQEDVVCRLTIRDASNFANAYTIMGIDDADALLFDFQEPQNGILSDFDTNQQTIKVAAQSEASSSFTIRPKKRPLFGNDKPTPYKIRVRTETADWQTLTGQVDIHSRVSRRMIIFLMLLTMLLCLLGFGVYSMVAANNTEQQLANQTALDSIGATATAAQAGANQIMSEAEDAQATADALAASGDEVAAAAAQSTADALQFQANATQAAANALQGQIDTLTEAIDATATPPLPPSSITLDVDNVDEDAPIGSTVGSFTASTAALFNPDQNLTGFYASNGAKRSALAKPVRSAAYQSSLAYTYSIVGGDVDAFYIDGDVLKTAVLYDYETQSSYDLVVMADNGLGGTLEAGFVISINDVSDTPVLTFSDVSLDEGDGTAVLTVLMTGSTQSEVTVEYSSSDDTAVAGEDYDEASGTLTWAAGEEGERHIEIALIDDDVQEPTETFEVTLEKAVIAVIDGETAVVTISDNESTPTLSIVDVTAVEGDGEAIAIVTLTGKSSEDVTVAYSSSDGTAAAGDDYSSADGELTWAAGEDGDKEISVTIEDDTMDESDETLTLSLSSATNASIDAGTATVTIEDDDDPPTLAIQAAGPFAESAGNATLTVLIDGSSSEEISVSYATSDDTATAGNDYTSSSGTITWAAESTSAQEIVVPILSDTVYEGEDETFIVTLSAPVNATIATAEESYAITDDDDQPTLSISSITVDETDGSAVVTVAMSGGSSTEVTVEYTTVDDTAIAGDDYGQTASPPVLTWAADEQDGTRDISIVIHDDDIDEGTSEAFSVNLLNNSSNSILSSSSATVTITDNDDSTVIVNPTTATISEPSTTDSFNVSLGSEPSAAVLIPLSSADPTQCTVPTSVTINPIEWRGGVDVTITPVDDSIDEADGLSCDITTGDPTSGDAFYEALGDTDVDDVTVTLNDDDTAKVLVSPVSLTISETTGFNTDTFNISLATEPTGDVDIPVTSQDTTQCTMTVSIVTLTSLTWRAGVDVVVTAVDESIIDTSNNCAIVTGTPTSSDGNYAAFSGADVDDVAVTVVNDDAPGATVSPTSLTITETTPAVAGVFTIILNSEPTSSVTFAVTVDNDCSVSPVSVEIFPADWNSGVSVDVTTVDDAIDGGASSCTVSLGTASSSDSDYHGIVDPNPNSLLVTVIDDDTTPVIGTNQTVTIDETAVNGDLFTPTVVVTDADGDSSFTWNVSNVDPAGSSGYFAFTGNDLGLTPAGAAAIDYESQQTYTMTVTASDGTNTSTAETIILGINDIDDETPTVTVNTGLTVDEGSTTIIRSTALNADDADTLQSSLAFIVTAAPTYGQLQLNGNPTPITSFTQADLAANIVEYVHDDSEIASDSFDFTVSDNNGNDLTGQTFNFTITPINDAPVAIDDTDTVSEDGALTVAATGVLFNDTDAENDGLTAILVGSPTDSSSFALGSDGGFSYSPAADFCGTDSFTYRANDGSINSNLATVTLTVTCLNDAPVAVDDPYNVDEDTGLLVIASVGVLANDTDADGDSLTVATLVLPSTTNGTLSFNADGSFSYNPDADYCGPDSFTYHTEDASVNSNTATVTITVNCINDAPVAVGDGPYSATEDVQLTVAAPGVLFNDTDVEGDGLTAVLDTTTPNGALALSIDGSFTYTSNTDYCGADSFTYHADDGDPSNIVTVNITVNCVNDSPTATDDIANAVGTGTVNINVLSNDSDTETASLQYGDITLGTPTLGIVELRPPGNPTTVRYTPPNPAVNATATFTYTICDDGDDGIGGGAGTLGNQCSTATVTINLTIVSAEPTFFIAQEKQLFTLGKQGDDGEITAVLTHQTLIPGSSTVRLNLYLNLQNADGSPNAESVVTETAVLLEDGSRYPAEISQEPTYLVLAVDASESMDGVLDPLRQTAVTLVNGLPDGSNVAVIRYDENIDLLQSFSSDHASVTNTLNSIQIEADDTCTYDAAYAAMQALLQTAPDSPNRTIILVSDGIDRDANGDIAAACSDYTEAQTIAYAAANDIAIHVIGSDGADSLPIARLAAESGGTVTVINDENSTLDQALMSSFGNQWMVTATMQPSLGLQRGVALLTLADGSTPSPVPVQFISPRDYVVPEKEEIITPMNIDISNFRYNESRDQFDLDVAVSDLSAVEILRVELLDGETNVQAGLSIITEPQFSQRVAIAADGLTGNDSSIAHAYALNASGGMVRDANGNPVEAFYTFQHTPATPPAILTIQAVTVEDEAAKFDLGGLNLENDPPTMRVQFIVENGDGAATMNGRLIHLSNNDPSETFTVTAMMIGDVGTATIVRDLNEGDYTLVLNVLDENGRSLTGADAQFNYTIPDGRVGRAGKALVSNPLLWLVFLVTLFIVVIVVASGSHQAGKKKGAASNVALNSPVVAEVVEEEIVEVQLTVIESPDGKITAVNQWQLADFPFTIGRKGCDLTIANDHHISRKHAQITLVDGDYFVEDLGSANGTFLNATKLAANEPFALSPERGERITIGKTTTFSFDEQTE